MQDCFMYEVDTMHKHIDDKMVVNMKKNGQHWKAR